MPDTPHEPPEGMRLSATAALVKNPPKRSLDQARRDRRGGFTVVSRQSVMCKSKLGSKDKRETVVGFVRRTLT